MRRLKQRDYHVSNVDVTILLERPKIGMMKSQIIASLRGLLGEAVGINIKAGTNEGCDSIGANGEYGDGEYPVGYAIEAGTYKAVAGNSCKVVIERQHSQSTSYTRRFRISVDDSNVRLSGGCRWKKVG